MHVHAVSGKLHTRTKRFIKILFSLLQTVFLHTNILFRYTLWKDMSKGIEFFHNSGSSILVWAQQKHYKLLYVFKANMHFQSEVVRTKFLFIMQNCLGGGSSKSFQHARNKCCEGNYWIQESNIYLDTLPLSLSVTQQKLLNQSNSAELAYCCY